MDFVSAGSYWNVTAPAAEAPRSVLRGELQTDVLIVGAGITGLTAAMHLTNAGRKVTVIEAGRVGAGTTGGTSGHLEALPDQGVETLISDFGMSTARAVTQARMAAIEQIAVWCDELSIDCDFRRVPAHVFSELLEGAGRLHREWTAARDLGLDTFPIDPSQLGLPFPCAGAFRLERQARFHSLRYLRGLATHLRERGCAIYEYTAAEPPTDGEPCTVKTKDGRISANHVLLCTHSAFLGASEVDLRVAAYQSYVMAVRVEEQIPDALFWDDAHPYHYLRVAASDDPRLVIIGGADHKTGQGEDERAAYAQLEGYVGARFSVGNIEQQWSAEFFEPVDGLPYIGRVPFHKHVSVATGFSGTGLTFGTMAGHLLADQVLERESPLSEIFTLARLKPLAAAKDFISENLNAARHFVADRFRGRSIESLDEVAAGEGALVRYRGNQWAVYRDPQGAVHVLAPQCTHAGCHVQWNEAESTWDCPCHGGRYTALGERVYGPATDDLAEQPLDAL